MSSSTSQASLLTSLAIVFKRNRQAMAWRCMQQCRSRLPFYDFAFRPSKFGLANLISLVHPPLPSPSSQMLGVCLPATVATTPSASSSPHHLLASVVELGENVDLIRLLQMSWDERLRVSFPRTTFFPPRSRAPESHFQILIVSLSQLFAICVRRTIN